MDVPGVFYKYRSLSGKDRRYVRDTIIGNTIYLASPNSFNDPFDCAPAFSPSFTSDGAYALARRYLSRQHPKWDEAKLDLAAKQFAAQTRGADMALVAQGLRDGYDLVRDWLALYCVSGTCASAMMWSHYADSHRGICIGFDSGMDIFAKAQPVTYSHVRHTVDPVHDSNEQRLANSLLLKSADWKYEKEWRYIDFEVGPGKYQLTGPVIRGVVLGARISMLDQSRVIEWIEQLVNKPKLLRAEISPNFFKVDVVPYVQT
jgi:hypothetical protein